VTMVSRDAHLLLALLVTARGAVMRQRQCLEAGRSSRMTRRRSGKR
jgi:hypothetical protein